MSTLLSSEWTSCTGFGTHTRTFSDGNICPVCSAVQEGERKLAIAEEKISELRASIEEYRTELGL